jgi:quercetin dioxygenase-like cupin family protein
MAQLFDRALPHDAREALFGGNATVRVWNLDPAPLPPFTAALACELDAGGAVGLHVQQEFAEIVIGISGDGRAQVDGAPHTLAGGSVVQLPLGARLAIENTSATEPLRYLILKARG